jgi:hypothetical protein
MALDRNKFKMKGSAEQEWDRMWPEKDHPLKEGDSIQGIFKGVVSNYGSNNSNVWLLDVAGETIGVWGSTVIDEHMKDIAEGSEVGIEFGGMADSVKRPGKQYKKFLVGVVDESIGEEPRPQEHQLD